MIINLYNPFEYKLKMEFGNFENLCVEYERLKSEFELSKGIKSI